MRSNLTNAFRAFWVLTLLVPEIVITRIAGDATNARHALMFQSLVQLFFGALLILLFLTLKSAGASGKGRVALERLPSRLGMLFSIYAICVLLEIGRGLLRDLPDGYVIGDGYKFLSFPLFTYIIYIVLPSMEAMECAAKWIFRVLLVSAFGYAILYIFVFRQIHVRPMAVFLFVWLPTLLYALSISGIIKARESIVVGLPVVGLMALLTWYSQSLTFFALSVMMLLGTLFFDGRLRFGYVPAGITVILFFMMLVVLLFKPDVFQDGAAAIADPNYYLTRKFDYIFSGGLSLRTLELMGGDRVAQVMAVFAHWRARPGDAVFGQGMGGSIEVSSVTGLGDRGWKSINHYIEAGYPQVMLRMGVAGLLFYIGILKWLFRAARRQASGRPMLALCAAYFLYLVVFSLFNEPLVGSGTGSLFVTAFFSAYAARSCAMTERRVRM
jgi:hypothetical protein